MKKSPFLLALCALPLFAAPHGAKVISGKATLSPEAARLVVENSPKAILEWDGFSIDAHEQVHFQQIDKYSSVLNRVVGGSKSALLGTLTSNGKVYLINPNGVLIGPNARIETASFIGSSLDILDADFLSDAFHFVGDGFGSVVNLGTISSPFGEVTLIGRSVRNEGKIEAQEGRVTLGAGTEVLLQLQDEPQVFIRSYSKNFDENMNPYAEAICEVDGSIDVRGDKGGSVYLLGEDVHLINRAHIDASGIFGGGEVFVGSKATQHVWASKESCVYADALEKGDGGKVILWSDRATSHYGHISVQGGLKGGGGGFAEVSGSRLEARGFVDGKAPFGKMGTLLLDPTDISINASATSGTFSPCTPPVNYNISAANPNNILNTDLQTQLQSCNVTISTVGSSGTGSGSITVSSSFSWSANTTLTLEAASFISIAAGIANTSTATGFTALKCIAYGVGAGANSGISITSNTTNGGNGDVFLFGNASNAATAGHGVSISGVGRITTASGNISIAGAVPLGPTSSSLGVSISVTSAIASTSGTVQISGTSLASGSSSHGVSVASTTIGTTGPVIFGNPITYGSTTIEGCQGGSGASSHGCVLSQMNTYNTLTATNKIIGGSGNGSCGYSGIITTNSAGEWVIAASTLAGGASTSSGINLTSSITTSVRLTLVGTGSPNGTGITNGVSMNSINSLYPMSIAGTVPPRTGGGAGIGVSFAIASTLISPLIYISGTSFADGTGSHGVSSTAAITMTSTLNTQNSVIFGNLISAGGVTIEGCQGGIGPASHGINVGNTISISGNLTAINKIIGGSGTGSHGFSSGFNISSSFSGDISITASTTAGGSTPSHGINLTAGTMSAVGAGKITLIGTASATNSGNSNGINLSGGIVSNSGYGSINLAGAVPTGATGTGLGVLIGTTSGLTSSGGGAINLSGTSAASGNGSHGVSITNTFSSGGGLLSFGPSITNGAVTVTGCRGGTGGASHGVNVGAAITATGGVAASNVIGGSGASGIGFNIGSAITAGSVNISASSLGSGANSYGISVGAALSTSALGVINLVGTGSPNGSGNANYGISVSGAGQISLSSSTGSFRQVVLTGTPGAGTTLGCTLNATAPLAIAGTASGVVTSTSGSIGLGGTFAIGSGAFEFGSACTLLANSTLTPTAGSFIFDGTIDGAFTFGVGSGGSVYFKDSIGETIPLGGLSIASDALIYSDVSATTASGGNIAFTGGIEGPYSLTLTAGGAGTVTLTGSIGSSIPLASFAASGILLNLGTPSFKTIGSASFNPPTVLTANSSITATDSITFASTIGGNHSLTLTSFNADISVVGAVDLSGTTGASLTTCSGGDTVFSDAIDTSGTADGGALSVTSLRGSLIVADIDTSGGSGTGGDIALQPFAAVQYSSLGWLPLGTIQINGTAVNASGGTANGAISLAPLGRTILPSVATIFGNNTTDNSVTFTASAFSMGANEAMTIFGNATIIANTSATVSDIVALNTLTITSPSITLNTQASSQILSSSGALYTSPSAHLLSGSTPVFSSAVNPPGSYTGVSGAVKADLIYATDNLDLNYDNR